MLAAPGVGKTACLIPIGLDDLMRKNKVLHIALGGSVQQVCVWYDELFKDLAGTAKLKDRDDVATSIRKLRIIRSTSDRTLHADRLERVAELFQENSGFTPEANLVDGYDWTSDEEDTRLALLAFKAIGQRFGAEIWMTARAGRTDVKTRPSSLIEPCLTFSDLIDVGLLLEPSGGLVSIRLVKDHDNEIQSAGSQVALNCESMRLVVSGSQPSAA